MIEYKGQGVAVVAKDLDEFRRIIELAVQEGFRCGDGIDAFVSNCVSTYGDKDIGISLESGSLSYCDLEWFGKYDYKIMLASEFLNTENYYIIH